MWLLAAKSIRSDYTHRTREVMYTVRVWGALMDFSQKGKYNI